MNKKFLSAVLFGALMVTSTGTFVSCKDYDDDIDRIDNTLNDLKSQLDALQTKFEAGKYITNVATTAEGITITLNDGSSYPITNGKDGDKGEAGAPGDKVEINDEGFFIINGKVTEWKAVAKDASTGETIKIKTPTVSEDGCWVFYDEKGEAHPTTIKVAPVTAVQNADTSWTLTVWDANGKSQTIQLPTAASLLTELDLMGWAQVADASDDFSMSAIKNGGPVGIGGSNPNLVVNYKWIQKIIKDYDNNKETTWSAQKDVVKGQVLTTLAPKDIKLVARIAPATVDWSSLNFTLQDSKGNQLPIALGAGEKLTGTLTRANANSSMAFISMDVVADTYNNASQYEALFNKGNSSNNTLYLYSLVETSGYRSTYAGFTVTPSPLGVIDEQNVIAVNPNGKMTTTQGDGSNNNPFIIDLNTPTTLEFGKALSGISHPEWVYDYYVEAVDPKAAAEFGFSTDKKAGTITMTKSADLVSRAGLELNVYALHIDGTIYKRPIWVKPSSIMVSEVTLKAGEQVIAPIFDNAGNLATGAAASQTRFSVKLDDMFASMSQTDKDRWQSTVMGANNGAKVVKAEAAGETPAASDFAIQYLDKDGQPITDNSKAVALLVTANYKNGTTALLAPEKEYTLTVNFEHKEGTGITAPTNVLNTVKVTFTPTLPDLSSYMVKRTALWNDDATVLMAYFEDPAIVIPPATAPSLPLASTYDIEKGFTKFGLEDKAGTAYATIALSLNNNQKLSDDKALVNSSVAAATVGSNAITLNTAAVNSNGKVRAYAEELEVKVGVTYLGVYDYTETDNYKQQLKDANFEINVQSALVAGYVKVLEGTSIEMEPAAAGEVWKVTAQHVGGYTYSNQAYSLFKIKSSATAAVAYKYTYIDKIEFKTPDSELYTVVTEDGNTTSTSAVDPAWDASAKKEIPSYVALKPGNTTQEVKTTLNVTITDKYGYKKYVEVPLTINKAK